MLIRKNMKMADVIHLNYTLLPVISRFGIKLGFGERTLEEVCNQNRVDVDFFLEVINSFHDPDYFPKTQLKNFSLKLLVEYLKKTHQYYLEVKLPEIENLIEQIVETCCTDRKNSLALIRAFFQEYKAQVKKHIDLEENVILPYVLEIEQAYLQKKLPQSVFEQMKKYSIKDFADEHDNIEEKLYDLKNIIIKYLPPHRNTNLSNTILQQLFLLEKDLNDHATMEDKVLIPKVETMEKKLQKLKRV